MVSTHEIIDKYKKYIITSCVKKLEPVVLVEGKGAVVKDLDAKEYIDCWSGISVVNAGHCNPKVVQAAQEQAEKLVHVCNYVYHTVPVALLAEKLAQIAPGSLQKTFFSNSGAEAVECALKIGRKFTKKHEVLALMCSFHGRTIGSLSVTGQANRRDYSMGPYLGGMAFAPAPYCYRCSLGQEYPRCGIQCAKIIEDIINYSTSGNVAEFIAEPIMGEGGIIVPPKEYFSEVKRILDQHGILFIADEVQSGFARTGKMFAIEHYGVNPDIMPLAKGVADGFPLGACTTTADIGDSFEPGDHLSTFGGSPISCVAALANIDYILKENLSEQTAKKGEYLMKRLEEVKEDHDIIGEVRGKGLMIGIELIRDHKDKTPADKETTRIRDLCLRKGVLIGSGGVKRNVLRIQPPLVISEKQMDRVLEILIGCLKQV